MRLYHATSEKLAQDLLEPRTKNVQMDSQAGTARLTDYDDKNTPFVFAATDPAFAATYAIPRGVRWGNYMGYENTHLLLLEKESIVGDPAFQGGLYVFDDADFVPLIDQQGAPTQQMVSALSVDLKQADFEPITGLNDLMRRSVQLYQIADDYSINDFERETDRLGGADFLLKIHSLVEGGKVRWLNDERAFNPVQSLLPMPAQTKTGPSFEGPVCKF